MVALGSFYEAKQSDLLQDHGEKEAFAIHQYNKAIYHLIGASRREIPPGLVSLICFILFLTIELLQGDSLRASHLLRTEFGLLEQCRISAYHYWTTSSEDIVIRKHIQPMLIRFWLQVDPAQNILPKTVITTLDDASFHAKETMQGQVVDVARSVTNAKETLQLILGDVFSSLHVHAVRGDLEKLETIFENSKTLLTSWGTQYSTVLDTVAATTQKDHLQTSILLLKIQFQTADLILRTVVSLRDLPNRREFSMLVDLCEKFIATNLASGNGSGLFMDHAIIPTLFFTAVCCPDPIISERAISQLRSKDWREGFSNSRDVATLALNALEQGKSPYLPITPGLSGKSPTLEGAQHMPTCAWEFLGGHRLVVAGTGI